MNLITQYFFDCNLDELSSSDKAWVLIGYLAPVIITLMTILQTK